VNSIVNQMVNTYPVFYISLNLLGAAEELPKKAATA